MRPPARRITKKPDCPKETEGSRLAAQVRQLAGQFTPEERRAHFNAAMALIYRGATARKDLPRH